MATGDSPPRIPPRDRRETRRGGIPQRSAQTAKSWPAQRQPGGDIVKEHGHTRARDAQEIKPSTPGSSFGGGPAGCPLASWPVAGQGEDRGVQAGQRGIGAGGAVSAVPAGSIGGDVGADEAEDGGERDEAGIEPGGSGGAGGGGGHDVVDEQECPGFLAGEFGGLAAQWPAGAADGSLQVEERYFYLPSLGIQDGDLPGGIGLVIQEGGQHPHPGGLGPAAAGHGGDGEGDQPGGGVREPFRAGIACFLPAPGPHAV